MCSDLDRTFYPRQRAVFIGGVLRRRRASAGPRARAGGTHPVAHRDRDRAERACRTADAAGERDRRVQGHAGERRHQRRQRSRDLRAEHALHRLHRPQVEQPAVPWYRLEPGQPGHHDVPRRRAAAQLELVEHRPDRRRSGRVRPRTAERAVRTQHARRRHQRHQRPAVADRVDVRRRRSRSSNFDSRDVRASVSGPLAAGRVGVSGSIGYGRATGSRETSSPATTWTIARPLPARDSCSGRRRASGRRVSS